MGQHMEVAGSAPFAHGSPEFREESTAVAGRREPFPSREAREIVRDLITPNLSIYWADFLFHIALGWAAFVLALSSSRFSAEQIVFTAVSVLALYRSVIFIHELAHRKEKSFGSFLPAWNLLCGFPLLTPSFTYQSVHNDHHNRNVYGTQRDGEYVDFALRGRAAIVRYPFLSFVLPLVLAGRFLILAPLSLLFRSSRGWVWERASSLAIDLSYRRRAASSKEIRVSRVHEAAAFLYGAVAITLVATGVLPVGVLVLWYGIAVVIFFLNSFRTLAAHRYRNPGDHVPGLEEQFLDSVDVPGHPFLTALWAPVGLRYHATHHLFPGIPYHALGEAHRRLVGGISDNEIHLAATRRSLWDALGRLWRDAGPNVERLRTRSATS
jgi:fatty acid desaturase